MGNGSKNLHHALGTHDLILVAFVSLVTPKFKMPLSCQLC